MYYIGTLEQTEKYNTIVVIGEGYNGVTLKWATANKHPDQDIYSIKKHPSYDDEEMTEVEELSQDWFPDLEI